MKIYEASVPNEKLHQGTHELLEFLKTHNKIQYILSAAEQQHLQKMVSYFNLTKYMEKVCGTKNIEAGGKIDVGEALIKSLDINDLKSVILVGDTDHDLEVASHLGIDCLLIADGHQSYEKLQSCHHNVLSSRYI